MNKFQFQKPIDHEHTSTTQEQQTQNIQYQEQKNRNQNISKFVHKFFHKNQLYIQPKIIILIQYFS